MGKEIKYKYSGSWLMILFGFLLFGGGAAFFYYQAINRNEGLLINGIIELEPLGASIFLWIIFTLSATIVLMLLVTAYFKLKKTDYLIIDGSKITIPPVGLNRKTTEIHFSQISEAIETHVSDYPVLTLHSNDGRKRDVNSQLLGRKNYLEVRDLIIERVGSNEKRITQG